MKQNKSSLNDLSNLGKVIKAYEEIAATRMRKTKDKVLINREYTDELNQIFKIVKNSYKKEAADYNLVKSQNKNGKTARVLLSSNTGLYGDMVQRIYSLFIKDVLKSPCDTVIVGRLGKSLFSSSYPSLKYQYFEIPDKQVGFNEFKNIIDFLKNYETVIIYHGYYKNIIMQDAVAVNLSGDEALDIAETSAPVNIIFEPSLPEIFTFFENEIFSNLMAQAVFESQLAKFSARMSNLEQAGENIKKEFDREKIQKEFEKKRLMDKKQLEMLTGSGIWKQ